MLTYYLLKLTVLGVITLGCNDNVSETQPEMIQLSEQMTNQWSPLSMKHVDPQVLLKQDFTWERY